MRKITLQINGRRETFSEEELTAIVEEKFNAKNMTEGKWYKVKPSSINKDLFVKEREDAMQEDTRRIILAAFYMIREYPEKYGQPFEVLIPEKVWTSKTYK